MGNLTNSYGTTVVDDHTATKIPTINETLELHDNMIAGKIDITITTADVTLTGTPAAPQAQKMFLDVSGALTANRSLLIPVAAGTGRNRIYVVKNGTSGAFTLTVKKVGGAGVTVGQGNTAFLLYDGSDITYAAPQIVTSTGALAAVSGGSAWASWTPTWTNLTIGNATVVCRYQQIGKTVICRLSVVWGSSTSITAPGIQFTIPVTRAAYGGSNSRTILGQIRVYDASAFLSFTGHIVNSSTTQGYMVLDDVSATYSKPADVSSTVPFTWATGDEMNATFVYESA